VNETHVVNHVLFAVVVQANSTGLHESDETCMACAVAFRPVPTTGKLALYWRSWHAMPEWSATAPPLQRRFAAFRGGGEPAVIMA